MRKHQKPSCNHHCVKAFLKLVIQTYLLFSTSFNIIFAQNEKLESFIAMKFIFIVLGATCSVSLMVMYGDPF
ncbi:hypothetical protein COM21_29730 [Bacillus toyonensis]|nr:hypothetical protein CON78_30385 [Bacillus toyonensis]PEE20263.1 hypothetical protein CON95_29850 [Bacillus toyonensis]PEM57987.1 hypothetical protein CN625_25225 [Bacillus toyonensis]PFX80409.1 hypothetical protein COL40_28850 [Bacillus toyonensis]PGC61529.1 hypothetical protein COM21_29730 [Bacillus toyonensis]